MVRRLLAANVSMRECARTLRINRKTVVRKKIFLGIHAKRWLVLFRKTKQIHEVQFDDMETFEHTKCKPVSITLAVEKKTRLILGFEVSPMPAKGRLSKKALKKYGPRPDLRKQGRRKLLEELKDCVAHNATFESDMNPHYAADLKDFFPFCTHKVTKGRRGCVVGQGELKSGGFDPLFSLNHTCAMFRASVSRLIRRTWCTTKKIEALRLHLAIYAQSHNQRILALT